MRAACDRVLCGAFNIPPNRIRRFEHSEKLFVLDQQFHIDVVLTLMNNSTLTGQEKALSNRFYGFRTFTMEFYQNRHTKERGEFFKIASQFYLHGYSDETGLEFCEWYIFDVLRLIEWLKGYGEDALAKQTRPSTSRASFLPIKYDRIPDRFILRSSRFNNSTDRVAPEKPDSQPACRGSLFLGRLGGAHGNEKR